MPTWPWQLLRRKRAREANVGLVAPASVPAVAVRREGANHQWMKVPLIIVDWSES